MTRLISNIFGKYKIQKDLTFDDDTGTVSLFTVTGDVFVNIIAVITTNLASVAGANIQMGVVGYTDAMIINTVATTMDAREIWNDSGASNEIESLDSIRAYIITDGNNIVLLRDRNNRDTELLGLLGGDFGRYDRTDNGRDLFFA